MTRLLALLGDPVGHSLSPRIQNAAFRAAGVDGVYLPLRTAAEDLPGLLRGLARAGGGGNVTLPHKERAAGLVERATEAVVRTGACNTFWLRDGRVHGDNTDVAGFRKALHGLLGGSARDGEVLVMGAGGGARAVVWALIEDGAARVSVHNRTPERARELAGAAGTERVRALDPGSPEPTERAFDVVVNATRLGLRPGDSLPIDPASLRGSPALMDLVYRPEATDWVRAARAAGLTARDGGDMLVEQGAAAFERWWDVPAPLEVMRRELEAARAAVEVRG
jgi:shikimate dehydrogenase